GRHLSDMIFFFVISWYFIKIALFTIWGDDAGKAEKLLFARKEVFPLSPRPSHPFKKSGKTFLFTFTYHCREQSH
ncbi:MAG: hypothetical protein J6R00_06340, partial [Lentisphaeria bacterium]|nr:hypothetical protein [Lentisphaeria bacterium]